ncbi:unnamed protein product [Linum trigynum]|uniref:Reverse transcriptase Ty1/copia-type domain-containing protein n=1 Tax=Linum trigynum TaxID=586398 RepID=A0AAV2CMD3_9ROSI
MYFLVYVDDLLLTRNHGPSLTSFQERLAARFSLKILGNVDYFLGIEVLPSSVGYLLSQHKYVLDLLQRFDMVGSHPAPTPLSSAAKLQLNDGSPPADPTLYKQALGSLPYLLCTRPDIAFAVNKVSHFMHAPTELHWQHVKHLHRYLRDTTSLGLRLSPVNTHTLVAFVDSDWAGDPNDRNPPWATSFTMTATLYLGSSRNNGQWRAQVWRLNTALSPMPHPSYYGHKIFSWNFIILFPVHPSSTVTTSGLLTSQPTQFTTRE